jgi:hypothetical protein
VDTTANLLREFTTFIENIEKIFNINCKAQPNTTAHDYWNTLKADK